MNRKPMFLLIIAAVLLAFAAGAEPPPYIYTDRISEMESVFGFLCNDVFIGNVFIAFMVYNYITVRKRGTSCNTL